MQKAEPQHGQTQHQPAAKQGGGLAVVSPQGEHIAQLETMMDSSPQSEKLGGLAAMMNNSPAMSAQRKLADMMHNSPRQTAQRKKFDNLFGTAQRVAGDEQGGMALSECHMPEVLQRVLDTNQLQYRTIIAQYPDAGSASGKCHDAALALKTEADRQGQPWNYVWVFCESGMAYSEDHVAVESGGTVYDPTLQQFPGINAGMWIGTIQNWKIAVIQAYTTKVTNEATPGRFLISFDHSTTPRYNAFSAPEGLDLIATFEIQAPVSASSSSASSSSASSSSASSSSASSSSASSSSASSSSASSSSTTSPSATSSSTTSPSATSSSTTSPSATSSSSSSPSHSKDDCCSIM